MKLLKIILIIFSLNLTLCFFNFLSAATRKTRQAKAARTVDDGAPKKVTPKTVKEKDVELRKVSTKTKEEIEKEVTGKVKEEAEKLPPKKVTTPKKRKKKIPAKDEESKKEIKTRVEPETKKTERAKIYEEYGKEGAEEIFAQKAENLKKDFEAKTAWNALEKADAATLMKEYAKIDLQIMKLESEAEVFHMLGKDKETEKIEKEIRDKKNNVSDLKEKIILKIEGKGFDSDVVLKGSQEELSEKIQRKNRWKELEASGVVTRAKEVAQEEERTIEEQRDKFAEKIEKDLEKSKKQGKTAQMGETATQLKIEGHRKQAKVAGLKTSGLFKKGDIETLLDLNQKVEKSKGNEKITLEMQRDELENSIRSKIKTSKGLTNADEALANAKMKSDNDKLKIAALENEKKNATPQRKTEINEELKDIKNSVSVINTYIKKRVQESGKAPNDIEKELDEKVIKLKSVDKLIEDSQNDILKDRGEVKKIKRKVAVLGGLWMFGTLIPGLFMETEDKEVVILGSGMTREDAEEIGDTGMTEEELDYLRRSGY